MNKLQTITYKVKFYLEVLGMAFTGKLHQDYRDLLEDVTDLAFENAHLKKTLEDIKKIKKDVKAGPKVTVKKVVKKK